MKNIILYESKYGATKKASEILSLVVGYSKVITTNEMKEVYKGYINFIIMCPVYSGYIDNKITEFIKDNAAWLKEKNIYLCTVNLEGERGTRYLVPIKDMLKDSVKIISSIHGNLLLDKLGKEDYDNMKSFSEKYNMPLVNIEKFNVQEVINVALDIKKDVDSRRGKLDKKIVKEIVTKYIEEHNTAVLCTGRDNEVRATPIEYNFYNNAFYFISEGGIKFANMLINKNVSLGIFEEYKNMVNISGMQITGEAKLVEYLSDEYFEILSLKKITKNTINNIPVIINVFKVDIKKVEMLNTEFKKYHGDSKQIVNWE